MARKQKQKTRRRRGAGTVYQAADGRWYGQIDLGKTADGKRNRPKVSGESEADVEAQLDDLRYKQRHGLPIQYEQQTVADFMERWLKRVQRTVRPGTYADYRVQVEHHIIPAFGSVPLVKLTAQHVEALLDDRLDEGYQPSTVRKLRAVLWRALEHARELEAVPKNVAANVKPPKVEERDYTFLTPTQARQFLQVIAGDRLEALYTVALALGLRHGEALGLEWSHVDFTAGRLTVRQSLQYIDNRLTLVPVKTKAARRDIALPSYAITALHAHRARQLEERMVAGRAWQDHGLVFCDREGGPLWKEHVRRHLHQLTEQAGLPRLRVHDLRHSCASLLLAMGVHPKVAQGILGHASVRTTLDIYSHVAPEVASEAAALMDQVLGKKDAG